VDESCRQPGGYQRFDVATYYPELLRQLALIPGAKSVALSRMFPGLLSFDDDKRFLQPILRETDARSTADALAFVDEISPNFFNTMRIGMIRRA